MSIDTEGTLCWYCGEPIFDADGIWVDDTDGDICSGDDNLDNENLVHTPTPRPT